MALEISKSSIHGIGLKAGRKYRSGEWVMNVYHDKMGFTFGSHYVNHADNATQNTTMFQQGQTIWIAALGDIQKGEEITANYKQLISYRPELKNKIKFWK